MSFCPYCGSEITQKTNYCPNCGSSLQGKPKRTQKKHISKALWIALCSLSVFCILAGCVLLLRSKPFADNSKAIGEKSRSVVLLQCYDKSGDLYCTGSAFSIFADGVFVTNYHVVAQKVYRIVANTEDGIMFEIDTVLTSDPQHDIAILKTSANTHVSPLRIGSSEELKKGEKVVAIGSPLGFLNTVSTGVFSGFNQTESGDELQFSASISHGSSGGALLNNRGEVIGITCGSYEDGQNLNVAVPIQYAIDAYSAPSPPMTVSQFYDTFDHHTVYTVDEVLRRRDTISDDCAYIVGYIADIDSAQCHIVSDPSVIEDIWHKKKSTWDELSQYYADNAIDLMDLKEQGKIFRKFQIGDFICVKTRLKPGGISPRDQEYVIYIRNSDNIFSEIPE